MIQAPTSNILCSEQECEPPCGGKEDCEFNIDGCCVAVKPKGKNMGRTRKAVTKIRKQCEMCCSREKERCKLNFPVLCKRQSTKPCIYYAERKDDERENHRQTISKLAQLIYNKSSRKTAYTKADALCEAIEVYEELYGYHFEPTEEEFIKTASEILNLSQRRLQSLLQ